MTESADLGNDIIERGEDLIACFEEGSVLRERAEDSLKRARETAQQSEDPEDYGGPFPPFFCLMVDDGEERLKALERDFDLVRGHTRAEKQGELDAFWSKNHNEFHGGLFDMRVKAALLRGISVESVTLDHQPAGGDRECDAVVTLNERQMAVEATVLSTCEYEREDTRRALEDDTKVWTTPGPYTPEESKWPNPYYTTVRIYAKIYEKLAPKLQPGTCQFPEDYPGVLAISLDGVRSYICRDETDKPFEPGVYWAFDELFLDQPWGTEKVQGQSIDTSLQGWLREHARYLVEAGRLDAGAECATSNELIALPRRISGVLMFNRGRLVDSRLNYHANRRLSHAEMAELEALFTDTPAYY